MIPIQLLPTTIFIIHIIDEWWMAAWLPCSFCCKSESECLETASNSHVVTVSLLQQYNTRWHAGLMSEVSNLESKTGNNLRIFSSAPARSNSHWQYFVLSWCFCHKGYRIRHTKVCIVIKAHWDGMLETYTVALTVTIACIITSPSEHCVPINIFCILLQSLWLCQESSREKQKVG